MAKVRQHDGDLYVSGNLRVLGGIQNVKNSETVTRLATSESAITAVESTLTEAVDDIATITEAETDPNQMTPKQKQGASISWNSLVEYHATIVNDMTKAGVPLSEAAYVNYDSAYDSLYAYLFTTPACLSDLTTTTTIVYVTFSSLWLAEASYRAELQSLIQSWGYIHGIEDPAASSTRVPVPPVVTANIMFNTAYLRWPAQAGLSGEITHRIERSDVSNFASHVDVATVYGNTYTDEGLALNGTDDTPTSRTYYYRVIRIVNATVESNASNIVSAVAASLSPKAIAANAINSSKLAAGAVADMTKFASTIRPPRVVTSIPATPYTGYENGDTVVLNLLGNADHGKLFRLKDKTQATTIEILPALGAWSKAVSGGDIVADSITAGSIAAGAIGADEIAADAVTASKIVAGARNSPNDPAMYWSLDGVADFPDDTAGLIYLKTEFVAADIATGTSAEFPGGFANYAGSGFNNAGLSIEDGMVKLDTTTVPSLMLRWGVDPRTRVTRLRMKCSKAATLALEADGPIVNFSLVANEWALVPAYIASGGLGALDIGGIPDGSIAYISGVYIGTGVYLDNSVIDNSGDGLHGRLYGGCPVAGVSGRAIAFHGLGVADCAYVPGLSLFSTDVTISWWENDVTLATNKIPISAGYDNGWYIHRGLSAVISCCTTGGIVPGPTVSMVAGEWRHYCVSYSVATRVMTVYSHGVASTPVTLATPLRVASYLSLGSLQPGNTDWAADCGIDEVRLYYKVLTEAQVKYLTENKVTTTGMVITDQLVAGAVTASKIFAGAITTDKLAAEAVTAVKINVADLAANTAFVDALTANTAFIDDLFVNNIEVPTGGSIRYETGSGVQKRCVQLADEKIDWLDTPDTSPASPEQLRARIGRLGVGGSILFDGDFLANVSSVYGSERVINASNSYSPAYIQLSSGELRIAYQKITGGSSGPIEERIWNGTSWGTATAITVASADLPTYIQLYSGELRVAYRRYPADNYIVERIWNGSTWGAESVVNNAASGACTYIQLSSGELRIAYQRTSDGYIVERIWNGSTWGSESVVNNASSSQPSYIQLASGELRVAYRRGADSYIVERIWNGSAWGADSVVNNAASFSPAYTQYITGELRIAYKRNSDGYIEERIWNSAAWGAATAINSVNSNSPTYTQNSSGELRIAYQRVSDNYIVERTLQRYAQIGAGIIESGSNSNGSWIKYGDGTMECWDHGSVTDWAINNAYGSLYQGTRSFDYPVEFIDYPSNVSGAAKWGTGAGWNTLTGGESKTTISIRSIDILSRAVGTAVLYSWRAIGRWKA